MKTEWAARDRQELATKSRNADRTFTLDLNAKRQASQDDSIAIVMCLEENQTPHDVDTGNKSSGRKDSLPARTPRSYGATCLHDFETRDLPQKAVPVP